MSALATHIDTGCSARLVSLAAITSVLLAQLVPRACQAAPVELRPILAPTRVAEANVNVFASPVAVHEGIVFTANVEPPPDGVPADGVNLRTVVRRGVYTAATGWHWTSTLLDAQTLEDPYHTQPSIAVDRAGFVHVAYNMHNMPWQYAVSARSVQIDGFEFRGEPISLPERRTVRHENRTPFAHYGRAAIPGTQVTYPYFVNDRNGELYVTYRHALRPRRAWAERDFAGGLARYDVASRTWRAIGGAIEIDARDAELADGDTRATSRALIHTPNWSVYLLRPCFDATNRLHMSWTWREGGAGSNTTHPSYASAELDNEGPWQGATGSPYRLPIGNSQIDPIADVEPADEFHAATWITTDEHDDVYVLLQPRDKSRVLTRLNRRTRHWSRPVPTPYGATVVIADEQGSLWAFATGLRVFRAAIGPSQDWRQVFVEQGYCYPKVLHDRSRRQLVIHSQSCDLKFVRITALDY